MKESRITTAATRVGVVLGDPVGHSLSPALHNAAFAASGLDAVFVALRTPPESLREMVVGLRAARVLGMSVTVPHKESVLPLCDRVDELALAIGAVNCLVIENDGALVGHNTDAPAFVDALAEELGFEPGGKRAVILGAGGAARAVAAGLAVGGADQVTVIARRPTSVSWTRALPWTEEVLSEASETADLVVDCTSRSLHEHGEAQVPAEVPVDLLPETAAVVSLVYHRKPALLNAAERRGLMVADGAGMLVHQGARAFTLWTGEPAPLQAMWSALGRRRS